MINFKHVGLRYGVGPEVLSDVSFRLDPGSFHFLTGASGAGKSSLLSLLYLGRKPTRGVVTMFGRNIMELDREELASFRQRIGVVFQDFRLLPHLSVFDNVALPLRVSGRAEPSIRSDVQELLDWVGLADYMDSLPLTLSGGQQQRVAIARAVIGRPQILLADEPTGNLDDEIGQRLMGLFQQLNQMGTTLVIATHSQKMLDLVHEPRLALHQGHLSVEQPKNWIERKIEGVF